MRLLFTALACLISVSLSAQGLSIGDTYQGGIVFYLDGNGGGLIAAPSDQSTGAEWGCFGTLISGADGTAIGTGNQNTIDIEAGCTTVGTAADICANYTDGTYSDWFLPSKDELNQMWLNLHLQGLGGFANYGYLSSTENGINLAWVQGFGDGVQSSYIKYNANGNVRAIRSFVSTPGCTDPNATNYDPDASEDDGSCEYLDYDGNGDGCVDINDMLDLLLEYGQCEPETQLDFDGNGDGCVNGEDVLNILVEYGSCE